MNVKTALQQGTHILEEACVAAPRLTAEVLLCHALRCEKIYLYSHPEAELSEIAWIHYGRFLHERIAGKPTQYITRQQEFYGRTFRVSPAVLIPRPETEHVIEAVLRLAAGARKIADIGTGSGAIAVTLSLELNTFAVATDISREALLVAAGNASRIGASVGFVNCDLCEALRTASMDLIASNPPYVPAGDRAVLQREVRDYEPSIALYGGPSGFEIYDRLIPEAARALKPGGWLVMELGYNSFERVRAMLETGWSEVQDFADLAGIPRVIAARYAP